MDSESEPLPRVLNLNDKRGVKDAPPKIGSCGTLIGHTTPTLFNEMSMANSCPVHLRNAAMRTPKGSRRRSGRAADDKFNRANICLRASLVADSV